ncbi:MAG: ATP-binding protein [Planctomycetota bacterium]|nr:ATP-binding protein [Planctomycetota bacterium]
MHERRLVWRLLLGYVLLIAAALLAFGWYASHQLDLALTNACLDRLQTAAELAADAALPSLPLVTPRGSVSPSIATAPTVSAQSLADAIQKIAQASQCRLTVILPSGKVIADSEQPVETLENHAARPEVASALQGTAWRENRFSSTSGQHMLYVALPVRGEDSGTRGAVRAAYRLATLHSELRKYQSALLVFICAIILPLAGLAYLVASRQSRPLEKLSVAATRIAAGELSTELPLHGSAELSVLAESLSQMAHQLEERSHTIGRQGHEQEAVLASMAEGVLAVDSSERIISINRAAADLIGAELGEIAGRSLQSVIRNADLRRFASNTLESAESIETDLILRGKLERILQVRGTALRNSAGLSIGAVIVLNDVTRYRQLENIRRDFVANVSHELKTPIASIKGFVETLLDGAIHAPEDAERFLRIVAKQAERLNAIIEDLLSLSKIEQSEKEVSLPLEIGNVRQLVEAAVHDCLSNAADCKVTVTICCDESIMARFNPRLLEQAIVNLLDNAIKYSEPGSEVIIEAGQQQSELRIVVIDQGCGIDTDHLPRIFERFYRVDKARSRKLGGTGLGLAIVKHIVQAHRGRVSVLSEPGKGSTFTLHLPALERGHN